MKEERGALYQQTEQGQGNDQGREKAKKMTKSRNKLKCAQIHTHTHTYCANTVPVNCSVLESLERHQRAWAASCSELQIPSWLNVDAWPSRLDQPLIHSLGPGNYWVSTEPHAATNNTHSQTCTCTQRGAWLVHRNAWHVCRPYCHENRQSCSQIQRLLQSPLLHFNISTTTYFLTFTLRYICIPLGMSVHCGITVAFRVQGRTGSKPSEKG